jgi:chemotaxis protein methyltransferase CheR
MASAFAQSLAPSGNAWHAVEPSAGDFRRLTALVHDISGISLNETKRALVTHRLSPRVRALGFRTFGEYVDFACAPENGQEMVRLLDLLTTNETQFFREPQHFEFLETKILPAWREAADAGRRPRLIRAWSAACSTGQEPYSIAMQLMWNFPSDQGWGIHITATDLSTRALDVAREAEWPIDRASQIPESYRHEFMLRGVGEREGRMRATRTLRESVQFARLNLNDEEYDVTGPFDMIFCRNVLIYFTPEGRAKVVDHLTRYLAPGGLLFVGHAESLHAHRGELRVVSPTIYERVVT